MAWLYTAGITFFFVAGGLAATLMRLELITPSADVMGSSEYNRLFTLHGVVICAAPRRRCDSPCCWRLCGW